MGRFRNEGAIEAFKNVYQKGALRRAAAYGDTRAAVLPTPRAASAPYASCVGKQGLTRRRGFAQAAACGESFTFSGVGATPARSPVCSELRTFCARGATSADALRAPPPPQRVLGWPGRQAL